MSGNIMFNMKKDGRHTDTYKKARQNYCYHAWKRLGSSFLSQKLDVFSENYVVVVVVVTL